MIISQHIYRVLRVSLLAHLLLSPLVPAAWSPIKSLQVVSGAAEDTGSSGGGGGSKTGASEPGGHQSQHAEASSQQMASSGLATNENHKSGKLLFL